MVTLPALVTGGFEGRTGRTGRTGKLPSAQQVDMPAPPAVFSVPNYQRLAGPIWQVAGKQSAQASQAGRTFEAFGRLAGQLGQREQEREIRQQQAQDKLAMALARAQFTSAEARARASFAGDPDYGTYSQRYMEEMQGHQKSIAGGLPEHLRQPFQISTLGDVTRGDIDVQKQAREQWRGTMRARLEEGRETTMQSALSVADETSAAAIMTDLGAALEASQALGVITPEERSAWARQWAEDYSAARLAGMTPEARLEALTAGSAAGEGGARVYNETGTSVDMLPIDERNKMIGEAQREIVAIRREDRLAADRLATLQKEALTERREEQARDFTERLYLPEGNPLTIRDIVDSDLTATQQRTMVNALETRAKGGGVEGGGNAEIYNDAFRTIARGDIVPSTMHDVVLPYVVEDGSGITSKGYSQLYTWANKVYKAEYGTKLSEFLDAAEGSISRSTLFGRDAIGDQKFHEFTNAFMKRLEAEEALGKRIDTLLDPESPDYLGPMINQYILTPEQRLNAMSKEIEGTGIYRPGQPRNPAGASE